MAIPSTKLMYLIFVSMVIGLISPVSVSLQGKQVPMGLLAHVKVQDKIKGMHYFGRGASLQEGLAALKNGHVNEIVLVPYAYQRTYDDPKLLTSGRRRNSRTRRDSSYYALAARAHDLDLKCIIKPHIWMQTDQGKWRSDIHFRNEADWKLWSDSYRDYILHYAALSAEMEAHAFCIGTELSKLTKHRPQYWKDLIRAVRRVYDGKLFYAANWFEEYEHITFWQELDFIGIQAYFPLTEKEEPNVDQLCIAWKPWIEKLDRFSRAQGKPILFTELGYKSTLDAAVEPWRWLSQADEQLAASPQTQANCYEAFFRSVWDTPWFAGVMFWQWQGAGHRSVGRMERDFTPQSKPAEEVMRTWFAD
ncbi:MAG: hypothetical protein HKN87_01735 [Saprospiraceae bacterium]|nr:hypothetical protein [Saprospiraceae bacterium]